MAEFLAIGSSRMPEVRHNLISSLKEVLIPENVLDEFQVAGVFVNWCTNIKYDLKTISINGWMPSLVPKEYFIETYFKAEQEAIQQTENLINEKESELQEAVESVEYEVEEEKEELINLFAHNKKRIEEMEAEGEPTEKKQKNAFTKTLKALQADNKKIEEKLAGLDDFLKSIGGVITPEECKTLILEKHNNLIQQELLKYLNAEKRKLIACIEKLWDKYAIPSQTLETERQQTLNKLNTFLTELKYL